MTIIFGVLTLITDNPMWVQIKVTIFNAMFAIFLFGGLWFQRNFFKYVFDKTFHYTQRGWDSFTWSFAWFFVFTAVANEVVRQGFPADEMFSVFGYQIDGVNVWILFRILGIGGMPLSGIYAWYLTTLMQKHRIPAPDPSHTALDVPAGTSGSRKDAAEFASVAGLKSHVGMVRSTPAE